MRYKAIFLGQKPIGEKCFDFLLDKSMHNIEVCGVVTNKTTNVWWKTNTIYMRAKENGISTIENDRKREIEILELINTHKVNLLICVQHPWILSSAILKSVNYCAFNLHNAKLPDYKGNNTYNHAILNKEKNYSCTIHYLADEVDMGDICYEETFAIMPDDTAKSLYEKSYILAQKLFAKTVTDLNNNISPPRKKINGNGFFYPKNSIDKLKQITNLSDEEEVDLKVRAFYFPPFEPAYIIAMGKKYYLIPSSS